MKVMIEFFDVKEKLPEGLVFPEPFLVILADGGICSAYRYPASSGEWFYPNSTDIIEEEVLYWAHGEYKELVETK